MFRFRNALPAALTLALTASLAAPVSAANDAPAIDSNWMSDSRVLSASQARQALAQLPDDAPAPKSWHGQGGRIGLFGPAWADVDSNGCDTRNDILDRDLSEKTYVAIKRCPTAVATGTLLDPYTSSVVAFTRGNQIGAAVQIDHIVPLALAWDLGARGWPDDLRTRFANDPANLLAVDGQANQDKGDKEPALWMPPNAAFHCQYAMQFIAVLRGYGLPVDAPSVPVLREAAATCPTG